MKMFVVDFHLKIMWALYSFIFNVRNLLLFIFSLQKCFYYEALVNNWFAPLFEYLIAIYWIGMSALIDYFVYLFTIID